MLKKTVRKKIRQSKHKSQRVKLFGTAEKPRLSVYRSLANIYAQIIDDVAKKTLVSCSTLEKAIKEKLKTGGNIEAAKVIGEEIANRAKTKNIEKVVFDRGGLRYHGRIKALADTARKNGLKF